MGRARKNWEQVKDKVLAKTQEKKDGTTKKRDEEEEDSTEASDEKAGRKRDVLTEKEPVVRPKRRLAGVAPKQRTRAAAPSRSLKPALGRQSTSRVWTYSD